MEYSKTQEIVCKDADDIYLGNLNRVEFDLDLPLKGKLGSDISWQSEGLVFLSHDGKVTRPTHGRGDRIVPLIATVTYKDAITTRKFDVTIVEKAYEGTITAIKPVKILSKVNEKLSLPKVVIAEYNNGSYSIVKVTWDKFDESLCKRVGEFTITGEISDTAIKASAIVCIQDNVSIYSSNNKKVFSFKSSDVSLIEKTIFTEAQNSFLTHLLSINDDQMLYNFRAAAKLDTLSAPPMTGWDAPDCLLKGHTTGHYLSALALAYGATKNADIKSKLDYMVSELAKCQNALSAMPECHEGFLSAYSEEQFDLLEVFTTYPTIWAPYYTLDKIIAGLMDCFDLAGNTSALDICKRIGYWVYNRLSVLKQEQLDKMWSMYIAGEFGGMIEALVRIYFVTGDDKFVTAAKLFKNEKLFFPMEENVDTLEDMHVNQHIPQIIGSLKLFEAKGETEYFNIAKNFWNFVTADHIYSIGGIGENEMFKGAGKIGSILTDKTAESCATYNMLKLTRELFMYSPEKTYMDYYENALYNHILSACDYHDNDGGTTYFMPLAPGSQKEFSTTENTCCHGTGLESPFKFTEGIYFHDDKTLYVNLYVSSTVNWKDKNIVLSQTAEENKSQDVCIKINGSSKFTLKMRRPRWLNSDVQILIDGKAAEGISIEDGYYVIDREWNDNTITVSFPFTFGIERTSDCKDIASISYGPFLLAAISDKEDFITLDVNEENINDRIKISDCCHHFHIDGLTLVPLNHVNQQHFHAYFKIK